MVDAHGVRLHVCSAPKARGSAGRDRGLTDGDDEGGEGVSADDAAIVHDVLGGNFAAEQKDAR